MGLTVMVVNGTRFLLNEDSAAIDQAAKIILSAYPPDAQVSFDSVQPEDVNPKRPI